VDLSHERTSPLRWPEPSAPAATSGTTTRAPAGAAIKIPLTESRQHPPRFEPLSPAMRGTWPRTIQVRLRMQSPPSTRKPRLPSAEPSELLRVPLQRGAVPWRARWRQYSCRGGRPRCQRSCRLG